MTYDAPKTWAEIRTIKRQMEIDLVSSAAKRGRTISEAGKLIGMERQHFSNTCGRLGIDARTGEVKR